MSRMSQRVKIYSFYLKKGPVSLAALGLKELDINMCIKIQNIIRDFNLGVSLADDNAIISNLLLTKSYL